MQDTLLLRFLYRTVPGRALLRLLVHPGVSKAAGCLLNSRLSGYFVPYYVRRQGISLSGMEVPEGGYRSFNDFFRRKRRVPAKIEPGCAVSPCEGYLSFARIRKGTVFNIKHTRFSVEELLKDEALAAEFEGGLALIFRLTPANYHRYSYAADGRILCRQRIGGKLHCVRPVATGTFPVYVQNSREYEVLCTDSWGKMVQMEIGALLVGRITNLKRPQGDDRVRAGEEKGYFEFGGSTILLLFQEGKIRVRRSLYDRRDEDGETKVEIGERLSGPSGKAARGTAGT